MTYPEIETDPAQFIKVFWTGLASLVDGDDPDDKPDTLAVEGNIIFTPSHFAIAYPSAVPKYTRVLTKRQVSLAEAQITEQGHKYILLEANVPGMKPANLKWRAAFSIGVRGVVIRIPDVEFEPEPGVDIDLTDLIYQ